MVADIGVVPAFVAVNDGILPVPLDANPMAVLEFVQAKVPPPGVLTKFVAVTELLLQTEIFEGTVTLETGITVIV